MCLTLSILMPLVLGYNLILFDIIAKTYSMNAGLAEPKRWFARLSSLISLEKGLILGALLVVAGAAIEVKIVVDWIRSGYGPLMAVKPLTFNADSKTA